MQRLNAIFDENPRLRVVAVAGVALLLVLILYTRLSGGSGGEVEEPAAVPPSATTATPATTAPAPGVKPGAKPKPREKLILQSGAGLPAKVARAYQRGKAIVLLITQANGIEDKLVRKGAKLLERRRKRVAVFRTSVENISAYSRITRGLNVSRVPALIVVPPGQTKPPLDAHLEQGFIDPQSILQAVDDALYKGPQIPPYPN